MSSYNHIEGAARTVALQAAQAASQVAHAAFRGTHVRDWKADNSPVTEVDHAAEQAAIAIIRQQFPDHAILAEESGLTGEHEYQWVIDPIDGTRNFTFGIPLYAVAVSVLRGNETLAAAVIIPELDQCFTAARGEGAWLNGEELSVEETVPMSQSLVAFSAFSGEKRSPNAYYEARARLRGVIGSPRVLGSAILQLCWVASGQLHALVAYHSSIWDLSAGVLIAQESGATALTYHGKVWRPGTPDLVLAEKSLATQLVAKIGA